MEKPAENVKPHGRRRSEEVRLYIIHVMCYSRKNFPTRRLSCISKQNTGWCSVGRGLKYSSNRLVIISDSNLVRGKNVQNHCSQFSWKIITILSLVLCSINVECSTMLHHRIRKTIPISTTGSSDCGMNFFWLSTQSRYQPAWEIADHPRRMYIHSKENKTRQIKWTPRDHTTLVII